MPITGYGADIGLPTDTGDTPTVGGPYYKPGSLAAVYIPPGTRQEPGLISLGVMPYAAGFDPYGINVGALHVSYGPMTLDSRWWLPMIRYPQQQYGTMRSGILTVSDFEVAGQHVATLQTIPAADGAEVGTQFPRPYLLDLGGHPGDPAKDGLLVVAQFSTYYALTLSVAPVPARRAPFRRCPSNIHTRDDALGRPCPCRARR